MDKQNKKKDVEQWGIVQRGQGELISWALSISTEGTT